MQTHNHLTRTEKWDIGIIRGFYLELEMLISITRVNMVTSARLNLVFYCSVPFPVLIGVSFEDYIPVLNPILIYLIAVLFIWCENVKCIKISTIWSWVVQCIVKIGDILDSSKIQKVPMSYYKIYACVNDFQDFYKEKWITRPKTDLSKGKLRTQITTPVQFLYNSQV